MCLNNNTCLNIWRKHAGTGYQPVLERDALIDALRKSRGNQSQAARLLGINRVTVWNRMRKYGIDLKKVISAL